MKRKEEHRRRLSEVKHKQTNDQLPKV